MSGIGVNLSFCKGYSIAMGHVIQKFNGATEWDIKLGMRLIASGNLVFQTFIVAEMIIYLIIIYGLHQVRYVGIYQSYVPRLSLKNLYILSWF